MKLFRKILFWTHLVIGLSAGLVIAVMAFTGASMAYEPQIMAALEREVRVVTPPSADAARLPIDDLVKKLREQQPDARPQSVTVSTDPTDAVLLSVGRDQTYYANPYTGEIRKPSERSAKAHDFFHLMESWHRWLAREGDQRPIGKAITGAADLIFLSLAISGLWLWWPRNGSWRTMRPSVWFTRGARGKARDWNWHNVIGLWASPVIILTTLTGAIMSFQWANNLLFRVVGSTPPPPRAEGGPAAAGPNAAPQFEIVRPEGARPLGFDALLISAKAQAPADWSAISIRTSAMQRRGTPSAGANSTGATPAANATANGDAAGTRAPVASTESAGAPAATPERPRGEGRGNNPEGSARGGNRAAPQPVTVSIRADSLSSPLQLSLNPFTGETLANPNAAAAPAPDLGRRLRALVKSLHTGTLGGWWHQTIMFLSAVGALVLVYTGFALAFRRFFKRNQPQAKPSALATATAHVSAASRETS